MRIEVEPTALIGAGRHVGSLGTQLGLLSDALGPALSDGIAAGTDSAGLAFGLKYGRQADDFAKTLAGAANAFKTVGYLLEVTGYNYQNADAASTIGGSGPSGAVGGEPSTTVAASVPAGPNGAIVMPPAHWYLVQPMLHMVPGFALFGSAMTWPTGNSALMQVTAAQWHNFATGLAVFESQLSTAKSAVAAQSIPEGATINAALNDIGQAVTSLSEVAKSVGDAVSNFANGVQKTQDAIRRLLDRLSFGGLWDTVTGFLTGDGDDILREIARDVGTVLKNFQNQVKGIVGLLEELVIVIGEAADAFQKWIRPVLISTFGDQVGGQLTALVTLYTDFQVGVTTALINTVSGVVSMADVDTWKGMVELGASVAQDPSRLPGVLENMGKEFVAWDKWSGDHPGRAAGEAAFNIGSLFVPGGALSKTGSVAKGLNVTRKVLEEGRLPKLGEVGSWARGVPELDGFGGTAPKVPEVPTVKPGALPSAPKFDSPSGTTPGRVGEPAGSSPSGKASSSGAEGGSGQRAPVDQPGRAPADTGPPNDSPANSPAAAGNGSEPSRASSHPSSSNGEPAPSVPHKPETPSPAGDHAGRNSASRPGDATSSQGSDHSGGVHDSDSAPSHHGAESDNADDRAAHEAHGLSPEKRDEIVATAKGERPEPSTYLSPDYIDHHLSRFTESVTRFMPESNLDKYGIAQRDGTSFVMPSSEADALINAAQGNPRALERALGLPEGFLDSNNIKRIDILSPDDYNLRIPSGNEAGANDQWIPGGQLPDGTSEAVIDGGDVPLDGYTVSDILGEEGPK